MNPRLKIWHLLGLFALALLPFAATFALPYPDERHYTDGAMQMLRDHDWLVPKTPQDSSIERLPRFQQPPLTNCVMAKKASPQALPGFGARQLLPWT